ncbi:MAG: hypothetical protein ACTHJ5_00450 [Ilyomonas sp.]
MASNMHFTNPKVRVVRVIPAYGYRPFYGYKYGFNSFYSPFGYDRFAYPYGYYRQSELDLQIEKINNDYQHDISTVRHDKSLTKTERKKEIRDLRHERNNAIIEAKKNYYNNN